MDSQDLCARQVSLKCFNECWLMANLAYCLQKLHNFQKAHPAPKDQYLHISFMPTVLGWVLGSGQRS